jgi:tetratricopeptide (TPR) repeat protein
MDRLVLILCGFALLLVLMLNFGRETLLRFEDWLSYTGSETRDARLVLWADSWSMFKHYIATGIGVGAFEYVFPAYQSQFGHKTFTHAENDYLQLLTECGIFGAFFIGFFLFVLFSNFARLLKQPMSPMIMGGWGAVFCMLFHGIYDFPFHIGSLSFVFVLLLGYVLVSPSVLSIEDRQSIHSRTRVCFMAISAVLICFVSLRSAPAEFSSDKLKQDLTAASLNSGSPAQTLENWPFYWRARELLAYEGVMSSEGSLEVAQDMLLSAQALFPANPLISRHAALLFWRRNPEVALDFLEFACMTSNDPSSMLVEVLDKIVRYPSDVHWILPLTLSTRGFWRRGWDVIHSRGFREFDSIFSDEGTRRWLQDPVERASASETMIRYGHVQAVINAFQAAPPVEAGEHYWLAEAYRTAGSHGMAVKHFKLACEALALTETSLPSASSEEFLLDKAELSPDDTNLQLEAAATLYHRGELEASIPFWNRVAKARPYYKPAILALALSYQRSGMDKEAMEHWRHLIGGPGGMEARLRELRTLEQKGNETPKTLPKT